MKLLRQPRNRIIAMALIVVVLLAAVMFRSSRSGDDAKKLRFDEFIVQIDSGQVKTAKIVEANGTVRGELRDGQDYTSTFPSNFTGQLTERLLSKSVEIDPQSTKTNYLFVLLSSVVPLLLLLGAMMFVVTRMQGGKFANFGKSKIRSSDKALGKVTFADVAGNDEAIEDLLEIKQFLEDPTRFERLGARIPRGVLLVGPPGTGKTLLARAVAGEAGRPFFSISGSDFVEMFVGVGAARVRDLFKHAKEHAPSIIFIDEIDAVGRQRGAGLGGGHDEREQTLNQLLVEMDGFDTRQGVIVMAATNRPDILDSALLRPGRFDRQVMVEQPDLMGRIAILKVHARGKAIQQSVSLEVIAKRTPGFTGADLENLLNEASILAVRRGSVVVEMQDAENAIDRIIGGTERRTRLMSDKERRVIAYHEGGHALVGHVLPLSDPVHKISILPRGRALGWTLQLPTEDRYVTGREELKAQLAVLLGGRTAEELVFGDPTTGAANDIERASEIAHRMVTKFGMSDVVGPQHFGTDEGQVFLGRDIRRTDSLSDSMSATIDAEVRKLIENAHDEARAILTAHREQLDVLAAELLEHETLGPEEVDRILGAMKPWKTSGDTRTTGNFGGSTGSIGDGWAASNG